MADVIEITAEVRGRELRLTSIPMMPSGSRNHLRIWVAFDTEWDGTTKTLVAYRDLAHPYHVPLGLDGTALIPHEVLAEQGVVYLGVFGVVGDQRITSTIVRYGVNEGALTEGLQPSDPTPEMWDQLISAVNEVRQAAESAMRDAQTAAQSAGAQANAAATSAQQAKQSQTAAAGSATGAQASAAEATKQATASEASAVRAEKAANEVEQSAQKITGAIDRLVIHETAAGNPAVIQDGADWQMEGLRVYGQSEQAGVPSPESPQEIVSKTVDEIAVTGANLINQPTLSFAHFTKIGLERPLYPGIYTFSGVATTEAESDALLISCLDDAGKLVVSVYLPVDGRKHHTASVSRRVLSLQIYAARNNAQAIGKNAQLQDLQIELGSVSTPYEPYHAQTVKLSAPVTLRGVPVKTGGTVTIGGKQYMADRITEREGVVGVKRCTAMIGQYAGEPVDEPYISTTGALTTGASVVHTIPEEFTPLPEQDQQAIRALRTYHGNTVITTGAHTEVDYIADPKLYIDGKVTSLVTAYMQSIPVTIPLLDEEVVENDG